MKKVKGNLITLAQSGKFDVIAHGVNCFNIQKAGLAPQMVEAFGTDTFPMEQPQYKGDLNKLGQIDYKKVILSARTSPQKSFLHVVNAYTQYNLGKDARPIALTMCLGKINHIFSGKKVGLPYIGAGIGGLTPELVEYIIEKTMTDCDVTLVEYDGS